MIQVFQSLVVGQVIKFSVAPDDYVRAECMYNESNPIILKPTDKDGYYLISVDVERESVHYEYIKSVH